VALLAWLSGRKASLMCVGVDRLYTSQGRRLAAILLRRLTRRIIVRDRNSYRRACVLAGSAELIELCPDPAFALRLPSAVAQNACVTLVPSRHDMPWQDAAAMFCLLLGEAGQTDTPVNMVLSDNSAAEQGYADRIFSRLVEKGHKVRCHVPETVDSLLMLLAAAPRLLSMRLHPLILSFADRNCVVVSDNSKMVSLARDLGLPRTSPKKWLAGEGLALSAEPIDRNTSETRAQMKASCSTLLEKVLDQLQ